MSSYSLSKELDYSYISLNLSDGVNHCNFKQQLHLMVFIVIKQLPAFSQAERTYYAIPELQLGKRRV